jgi:glycosyltransferase involved in cell wall biosynthesis
VSSIEIPRRRPPETSRGAERTREFAIAAAEKPLHQQVLWLLLPAYNEEQSLPPLLSRIADAMFNSGLAHKVVVVDDGSQDATAQIAESYRRHIPLILERHPVNLGLGATIRDGLTRATN